jgi:hypothetical protein
LSILFKCHYNLYQDNNFIININNDKTINFNNLLTFLKKINEYNLFTINLLGKYFKIPKRIITIVCDDLKYNIVDFINNLITPYLKYEAFVHKEDIDSDDIRYKYINENTCINPIDNLNLNSESIKYMNDNFKFIFDYTNNNDFGLIRLTTNFIICNNPYESLYNYIVTTSVIETNKYINKSFNFKNLKNAYEEYIDFCKIVDVYNYFEIIENQTKILFYDFNYYNTSNKIYCKYSIAPTIKQIISYLQYNNYYSISKKEYNKIYFSNISHHLLITPYLIDNLTFLNKDDEYIPNIMNIMNNYIDNIFGLNKLNLRNIDPDIFLSNINQLLKLFEYDNIKLLYLKKYILT